MALIFQHLTPNGDGTGGFNANGDYSSTEEIFYIQPPSDKVYCIQRMIGMIEDSNNMRAEYYGDMGVALTNGITVRVSNNNGVILDMTNGHPIKRNAEWGQFCYDVDLKSWGTGNEFILIKWDLSLPEQSLFLTGANGDKLELILNDDFSGLVSHHFVIEGHVYPGV